MDELYGNAWGEPSRTATEASGLPSSSAETWSTPKLSLPITEEVELAAPSWDSNHDLHWKDPSHDSHGFTWANADPDLAWDASTSHDVQTDSGYDTAELALPASEDVPQLEKDDEELSAKSSPITPEPLSTSRPPSPPLDHQDVVTVDQFPTSDSPSSSPEADAFGTFETAFDSGSKPFNSEVTPELDADAWGSPWVGGPGEESGDTQVDEWETARQQKAKLDRKIPPEVLANILAQCTEYCQETWPESDVQNTAPGDEWMDNWRRGLDSLEGLETLVQSLVPELTLQAPVQFTKTAIAKDMATAVRLTRNLPLSRNSPMSHYLAARGSTTWETAIKERKIVEEDVVPVGWRILEKQPANNAEPSKNAKTGGLFSFWGRRQSKPPSTQGSSESPREQSPTAADSPSLPSGDAGSLRSTRASQDSVRSRSVARDDKVGSPLAEVPSATQTLSETAAGPSQPTPPGSYSEAPDPHADGSRTPPPPQAPPSAVSRFLNRFSRRRSSMSMSSSHGSFALSSDDLEFLSDIVPTAHDGVEDDSETDSKALAAMLKAEPLPPALPPPPSAPQVRPLSTTSNKPSLQPHDLDGLDFFSAFGATSVPQGSEPPALTPSVPVSVRAIPSMDLPGNALSKLQTIEPPQVVKSATVRPRSPPSLFASPLVPTARSVSQPFYLPPPPSSRPQTPSSTSSISPVAGPSSEAGGLQRARSPALRPKVPLSFTVPPLSAASLLPSAPPTASSVMSTQSEVPLGELYPSAMHSRGIHDDASASHSATSATAFMLPPPPSSRPFTPSAGPRAMSPPLLAPPPRPAQPLIASQKPSQAIDLFDDDDDFADFQSSSTSPTEPLSAEVKLSMKQPPFALPPPNGHSTPLSAFQAVPPPPPRLPLVSNSGSTSSPSKPLSSDSFNGDFDSFLSSPSSTGLRAPGSRSSGFGISLDSDKALLTPRKKGLTGFEDGGPSPTLRTPSPPRPPTKSPRHNHQSISVARPGEKKVKAAQHLHTLSLMERAAAAPGRWPAPPSPLPQALSFPVPGAAPKGSVDLMGEDESFGSFHSDTLASSMSTPAFLNPARPAALPAPQSSQSLSTLSDSSGSASGYSALHASSSNISKAGGLSAQDLSFFEGL